MLKNRNNGPLFIAPRDEFGNKMIWDENKLEYVKNTALYAVPLKIAPRDSLGNKMIWNTDKLVYESKKTGQVFSTITMDFVEQRDIIEPECFMEEAALDDFDSDDEWMFMQEDDEDFYNEQQLLEEEAQLLEEEAKKKAQEEEDLAWDWHEYEEEEFLRQEEEDSRAWDDFIDSMVIISEDY